jgi:hypothetical protein
MAGAGGAPGVDCSEASMLADEDYFLQCVLGDPVNNQAPAGGLLINCTEGNCHGSGTYDFLNPPDQAYNKISTWISATTGKPFLVKNPESKSRLITYPKLEAHAGGKKWKPDEAGDLLTPLYQNTVRWLNREAVSLPDDTLIQTESITPIGFTHVPLGVVADQLGDPRLADGAISFFAITHSDTLLELLDLRVYPAPGIAIRIDDLGFLVVPSGKEPKDGVIDTSLYGEPATFVAPSKVLFGSGQVLLTDWSKGATLYLVFKSINSLLSDAHGNAFTPCVDVASFTTAVNKLKYTEDCTKPNSMMFCARQCHGGGDDPTPPLHTTKMELDSLFVAPTNFELGCAVTRAFTTPGNPAQTRIFNATEPGGAAAHSPFSFCGNATSWGKFKDVMTPWVCAEAGQINCSGSCADTKSDINNCGACGNVCDSLSKEVCNDGACVCAAGQKKCGTTCVDITADPAHCGDCNMPCFVGQTCSAGMCN